MDTNNGQFQQGFVPQGFAPQGYAAPQGLQTQGFVAPNQQTVEEEPVMFLKGQAEFDMNWADPGKYALRITKCEAGRSKESRVSMLSLTLAIEGGPFEGITIFDNAITEKDAKGAGFGVKKLRGLGINVDSEVPVPLKQIAASLTGKLVYADLDTEPRNSLNPNTGKWDVPQTTVRDGKQVVALKNKVISYYLTNTSAVAPQQQFAQTAPVQQLPVQQLAPAVGQMVPVQQQIQFAPQPGAPVYAQMPQQNAPWAQQAAPEETTKRSKKG